MKYARVTTALLGAVAALAAVGGCEDIAVDQRYGQVLPPGEIECPKGCAAYVTAPGDTVYRLAEKIYGKGYMSYVILRQEENKNALASITKEDGTLEKGKILFLPPDPKGRPVQSERPEHYRWW